MLPDIKNLLSERAGGGFYGLHREDLFHRRFVLCRATSCHIDRSGQHLAHIFKCQCIEDGCVRCHSSYIGKDIVIFTCFANSDLFPKGDRRIIFASGLLCNDSLKNDRRNTGGDSIDLKVLIPNFKDMGLGDGIWNLPSHHHIEEFLTVS